MITVQCNEKMIETITSNIFFSKFKENKENYVVDNTHVHHGMYSAWSISMAAFAAQVSAENTLHCPEG